MSIRRPTLLFYLFLLLAGLASCDSTKPNRTLNSRPFVRVVRGEVVDGDVVGQKTTLSWVGWDNDGIIDHYQYTFDIPDPNIDDINAGRVPGIAWRDTTVREAVFLLRTSLPETLLGADGVPRLSGRYLGRHTFYVRSVDNEGAVSNVDFIEFTATNIVPRTKIVAPDFAAITLFAQVGPQIYVQWTGRDPDKNSPDHQPVAYEYKLIPLPSIFFSVDPNYAVQVTPGPEFPWIRIPGNVNELRLTLDPPRPYWFVIRAEDAAGAKESVFIAGENAFKFQSSSRNFDRPVLTVSEATLGRHVFPHEGLTAAGEVFADQCLRFEFSADLSAYGGRLTGYNIGVDVADIADESPSSGFQGWSLTPHNINPICIRTPGPHTIVILCRDSGGGVTTGIYEIQVRPVPARDRGVLLVDDFNTRSAGNHLDAAMDAKMKDFARAMGFDDQDIFVFDAWGPADLFATHAKIPGRSELERYKNVVWHVNGFGLSGNGLTALVTATACEPELLEAQLDLGMGLWIIGSHSYGATVRPRNAAPGSSCAGVLSYNETLGLSLQFQSLLCQRMQLCGGDFREVRSTTSKQNGLIRAIPTPEGAANLLPSLEPDSTAYDYVRLGGLPLVNAAFANTFGGDELDSLYTMNAVDPESPFQNRLIAFRHVEADPARTRGALAMFGFSFHELKPGSAAERSGVLGMARAMGEWFRRHQVPAG